MSTVSVRLPDSIHQKIKEVAERDGISVDQFLASAAAEKLAAFLSDDYLDERAGRSSREAFEAALAQVPAVPPDPGDEL
jgi:predicted DNA-binding ribbon-helix-helix protein